MAEAAKKIEPQGEWLSESQIAKRCKLHRQTLSARLEDLGIEPDEERSNAKLKVYWFDDELMLAIKSAKDTLSAMKIRELRARAEKVEMQNAKERGDLVPIGEVTDLAQRVIKTLYDEHAIRMPKRVGGQLVKAKTIAAVRKILKTDADRVFRLMRTNFERYIDG